MAVRLQGKGPDIPESEPAPAQPFEVGAKQSFWAFNDDNHQHFRVSATLRYVTPHLYFWVGDGVNYNPAALQNLADTFEQKIYPTDREFFGSEWTPGIDNDPHLYALYVGNLGNHVAGYFSSNDEVPYQAREDSNAHEIFFINADGVDLQGEYIYSTMAHEFQHMIHWYRDRNETSWINEGFSVLAQLLNGYGVGGHDFLYANNPDLQLNTWESLPASAPHYGESFLFISYFLDRFGDKATQDLVANQLNGMASIDSVLHDLNITDPTRGTVIQADDIYADWVITSFLNDPQVGDGRFAYQHDKSAPKVGETERIDQCPSDWASRTVHQYGVDYIGIACPGQYTLEFEGSSQVDLLPASPASGKYAFWSNQGDELDMTLTRDFDFTKLSGSLSLHYKVWYDLEKDYDYVYLSASLDGQHWQILKTPSGTDGNPSGNNLGWGYTGQSGGWVTEEVDLSQFAGKKVQLRFEYITDAAINGEGLLLDNISIPAASYETDFESGDGGWVSNGFARIENALPQYFRVSLITQGKETQVQYLTLDDHQTVKVPIQIERGSPDSVLVVSGVTRFTHQLANYRFRFVK